MPPFSRPAGRHLRLPAHLVALTTAALALLCAGSPAPAAAASTCAASNITVTALQSNVFYVDSTTNYLGSYVGYRVTNSGSTTRSGLWVRLESFTGGALAPATGAATTSPVPLATLSASASTPTYAYLKATGETTTAQGYDVVAYNGRPGAGGTELCRQTQAVNGVADVIKAAANKVDAAVLAPTTATLGGTFQLTVTGSTGTIGSGPGSDPGIVRFSPAVAADWPSDSFRLVSVTNQFPTGDTAVNDVLSLGNMSGSSRNYTIAYTFRVVGPTTTPTPVVPVQNIASGTQVKHTDPSTFSSVAPIPVVTSNATVGVSAGGSSPYLAGATVPLTATVTNASSTAISLDEMVLGLPSGWAYTPGSATVGGVSAPDPYDAGTGTLHMVGPFSIPANATVTFAIDATASTSGTFTAYGNLAGGRVDATANASDNSPASTTLTVLGAPTAADDTRTVFTQTTSAINVLANDNTGGGTATLSIVTPPANGTATVNGTHIDYTPNDAYFGPDPFDYRLTNAVGSSDATVDVTVIDPLDAPAPPTPTDLTSSGEGTTPQTQTIAIPDGGSVSLLDDASMPTNIVTVDDQGTYALDPLTGVVTFTPRLGFTGEATAVRYRVTDTADQYAEATYTPTVDTPAAPAPNNRTSSAAAPASQHVTLTIADGGSVALLDGANLVDALSTDDGDYSLDPATGVVTFTPTTDFHGDAAPVSYRVTDAYGQTGDAIYTPTVTLPAAPSPSDLTSSGVGTVPQSVTVAIPTGGSAALIDGSGAHTSITVDGEGTYEIDPASGEVTFTAAFGFHGQAGGVAYRVTDRYGQTADATYVPSVTPPAAPTPAPLTSTGIGVLPQTDTITIPTGGAVALVDGQGHAVATLTVPGQGTYTLDPQTGVVTFAPQFGFHGAAAPVSYRVTDAYGQIAQQTYTPSVTPPLLSPVVPTATNGTQGNTQSRTLDVPPGGTVTLLDSDGQPTEVVTLPGVGRYDLNPTTGVITFSPAADYTGTPPPVTYRITDAYGQTQSATYTPTVVAIAIEPSAAPAAPSAPSATAPSASPARNCASRRTITIHWTIARGMVVRRISVTVGGKPIGWFTRSARSAPINLRKMPRGTFAVVVRATMADGSSFSTTRTFRTCRTTTGKSVPATLRLRRDRGHAG